MLCFLSMLFTLILHFSYREVNFYFYNTVCSLLQCFLLFLGLHFCFSSTNAALFLSFDCINYLDFNNVDFFSVVFIYLFCFQLQSSNLVYFSIKSFYFFSLFLVSSTWSLRQVTSESTFLPPLHYLLYFPFLVSSWILNYSSFLWFTILSFMISSILPPFPFFLFFLPAYSFSLLTQDIPLLPDFLFFLLFPLFLFFLPTLFFSLLTHDSFLHDLLFFLYLPIFFS